MSLTMTMKTATSGLIAAQTAIRTVSDNIANVNTPGYVRKTTDQSQLALNSQGAGVRVDGVVRAADQYLQLASLNASSEAGRWDEVSRYLDNAQSLFGDPSGDNFFFSRLDSIWTTFAQAADDPTSPVRRSQVMSALDDFMDEAGRINGQIEEISRTVDGQITSNVDRINGLLKEIETLNGDIMRGKGMGADTSGSENIQSGLLDELSTLMNIQVGPRSKGGVMVRTPEGQVLAGDGAAKLSLNAVSGTLGYITAEPADGTGRPKIVEVTGGSLGGLLELRNSRLPAMRDQLGEFMSRAADEINRAANANTASPAPATLTGRNTGLDAPTVFDHFTGMSTLAVVNASGVITQKIEIDFDAGTMTATGAAPSTTPFTEANFIASLNTALGGAGTASFANGVLSLQASGAGAGLALDEGTSAKAGRGFSHFFGLNDLIRSSGMSTYETGLAAADPHGFDSGDAITFRLQQADGKPLRDISFTPPAGGTMQDLVNALNSTTTGLGLFGTFSLDASDGELSFSPSQPYNARLSVLDDRTERGTGGPSMSQLFGIGQIERSGRASTFSVATAVRDNTARLPFARLDLTVAAGKPAVRPGDGSGARALAEAGERATSFSAAGNMAASQMTLSRYASELGGSIGREAAQAETRKTSAQAVKGEAVAQRQSVEGVNLDEELVLLTTYQQAYAASARMIQAAKELTDILTNMV